jgi:trehalose 6-phosphate synthase
MIDSSPINIVSYRCPFRAGSYDLFELSTGGLVGGIAALSEKRSLRWFCFDSERGRLDYRNITVYKTGITKELNRSYYQVFCNTYLWPLFHYIRNINTYHEEPWNAYVAANNAIADTIISNVNNETPIFVNDYHLALLPSILRNRGMSNVSFFWHVPWVTPEFLKIIPWYREMVRGILGASKIGFHTEIYSKNFRSIIDEMYREGFLSDYETTERKIVSVPLGIDYDSYSKRNIRKNFFEEELKKVRRKRIKIISTLSRLDYTKGIIQTLEAFRLFLKSNPGYAEKVVLVLAVSPSREEIEQYKNFKQEVDREVGKINSSLRTIEWTPVLYIYRKFNQSEVASLYRNSDLFLVTPLMDGLNIVAEEYIAMNDTGFLIISEFAGISTYIKGFIEINPFDTKGYSDSIKMALDIDPSERLKIMREAKEVVKRLSIENWLRKMV